MSVNVLLFDFGGVIYTPLNDEIVQKRREKLADQLGFSDANQMWQRFYAGVEWNLAKTGHIKEDEMWAELLAPLGLKNRQEQKAFVFELYRDCGLKDDMRELIVQLNMYYRLAILSNATDKLGTLLSGQLKVSKYFDLVVNSSDIRVAKPDNEAYFKTIEMLSVAPAEILFIDDQYRNTSAAEKLAIKSIVFKEIDQLRSDLMALDILAD